MFNAIDSRDLGTVEGFELFAYEVHDNDTTPFEEDCYSDEDIEAWRNDEWYYAGVIVVASREGIELGEAAIWGCDTGYYWDHGDGTYRDILEDLAGDPGSFAHGYGEGLIAEAIDEANETLARLMNKSA